MAQRNRHVQNQITEVSAGGGGLAQRDFALSPQQLWHWRRHEADGSSGKMGMAFLVESELDEATFGAALAALQARHEALRCTYPIVGEGPVGRLHEEASPCLSFVDVTSLSLDAMKSRVLESLQATLDLTRDLPFRWSLFQRDGKAVALSLQTHAVACDHASMARLLVELGQAYACLRENRSVEWAGEAGGLLTTLAAHADALSASAAERKAFWDAELIGELPVLNLQTDKPRPPQLPAQAEVHRWIVPAQLVKDLRRLAGGGSLEDLLLGALQVLLHRYTGQGDVLIAAQDRASADQVVGPFENLLPCRALFRGKGETVEAFLVQRSESLARVRAQRSYPWATLVADRGSSEADGSRMPLCQVRWSWQAHDEGLVSLSEHQESWQLGGMKLARLVTIAESSLFDLSFRVTEAGAEMVVDHEYNRALYQQTTIARMAANFQTLLTAMVAEPRASLGQLALLAEAEREDLIFGRNRTQVDYPRGRCFHHLFEDYAQRCPDKLAVVAGTDRVTYEELNRRANQIAAFLIAEGIGNEDFVGVCMHRSVNMVVALLGILKAGAAYVPLDPAFPEDRLEYMVQDSGLRIMLTEDGLADKIKHHQARVLDLDLQWRKISMERHTNPEVPTDPNCRAYVIYTSGSTGKPKGVQISHLAFQNFITSMAVKPGIGPDDVWLSVTTLSFDICGLELWGPLTTGATVVLAAKDVTIDGARLLDLLLKSGATIMQATPVSWRLMLGAGWLPGKHLKMLCGGEPLPPELAEQLVERGDLWNMYGPTETTVWSTLHLVPDGTLPISIGLAIANTVIYLIDSHFQLAPSGGAGELVIGGEGLARGYHNRPELTAQQFIPNPYSGLPGDRMYRTGDLARWLPNGNLECFGRIDHQVKVRGYRIELGEIESAIIKHDSIKQVVVIVREDSPGDKILVAYAKTETGHKLDIGTLRSFIRAFLPEYMVPSAFVEMQEFPLTPNGKVDKKNLPAPDLSALERGEYVAPRTVMEELLTGILAQSLKVGRVGITDNFFELGGHSLIATQVISRIREALQVEVPQPQFYQDPTVTGLVALVDRLRSGEGQKTPAIHPQSRETAPPLSANQQSLWFIDRVTPGNPAYNVPYAFTIMGRPDWAVFRAALEAIVARHEALRTCFKLADTMPVQTIHESLSFDLPTEDLSDLAVDDRKARAEEIALAEGRFAFDLAQAPLFRFRLLHLGEQETMFLANFHHTIFDGWSEGVFLAELLAFYNHLAHGQELGLQALPIQYADYSHWQQTWLRSDQLAAERAFWGKYLDGAQSVLELPRDKPRPKVHLFDGAFQRFTLDVDLTRRLRALSRERASTLFMTLQAAFNVFLYRYTSQADILVGTPIANRNRAETEHLLGYFVNTVVLRTYMGENPSFGDLLGRVRQTTLEAFAHSELPFDQVVEVSHIKRDLSRNPLFQVMFVLHNNPLPQLEASDFRMEIADIVRGLGQFDLTLNLTENEASLSGGFDYNTHLFEPESVQRMADNFLVLLRGIATDPQCRITDLPILTEVERKRLVVEWNDNAIPIGDLCPFQMFEARVRELGEAPAIHFGHDALSYAEVNARANRLAHHLRTLGVGPDVLVGISQERTPNMTISMLGIHKSGGAYVPLDPKHPEERIQYILEEARVSVIVTQKHLAEKLSGQAATLVLIDDTECPCHSAPSEDPTPLSGPLELSHVIYTSGSTGKPKGVAIAHRPVIALIEWTASLYTAEELGGMLASTSMNFDLSVYENIATLALGGSILLVENALYLPFEPKREMVRTINTVPSAIKELLRQQGIPRSVTTVNLAGEPLKNNVCQDLYKLGHVQRVYNLYGPSEDTTYSTWALMDNDPDYVVKIGIPLQNTQAYILDAQMRLVPLGVSGELWLAGEGLARGYLNRPDLTEDRFLPNPFSDDPQSRMYKTGDLVRWWANGQMECLGRIDHQVKIRGFRIELGEIEAVLLKHDHIREAYVMDRDDKGGEKYLAAYLTLTDGAALTPQEARDHVREYLPEYMVPPFVTILDAMPLNPNGKIERKALPAPEMGVATEIGQYVPPRTPLEETLCGIWATVLNVNQVGIEDNFFEMGGHSLLASQIVARVRGALAVEVPLARFLVEPTVAALARLIDGLHSEASPKVPAIVHQRFSEPPPLSLSQQRLWFIDQMMPDSAAYSIPFTFEVKGRIDVARLRQALALVVQRHESLRTSVGLRGGLAVQMIADQVEVALERMDLTHFPAESRRAEALRLAVVEGLRPFRLSQAPLFRFALASMAEDSHLLLLNWHHVICDGWSIGVFMREVISAYDALVQGQEPSFPEIPVTYADYAVWQRNWLQGEVLDKEIAWWRQAMEGAQTVLELPGDRARPKVQTYDGAVAELHWDDALMTDLRAVCRDNSATMFMLLHAAFNLFLYRYTGHSDILVGTPMANRSHEELENVFGFFVNTLVLRTRLEPQASFADLLAHVRTQIFETFSHQDFPFERLIEALNVERDLSRNPLFQVMFVLNNNPMPVLRTRDFEMDFLPVERGMAHFDLTFEIVETQGVMHGSFEYNTNLFERATAERMAGNFMTLLRGIAADPSCAVSHLPLLTAEERKLTLVDWNDNNLVIPELCPFRMFELAVERHPDKPAIYFGDSFLTYAEVNARANRLAHRLRAMGIGPDKLVGISQERTPNMTISMLGIQKSGGAYVPLDPKHPEERVQYIMDEARVSVIVTQRHLAEKLQNQPGELVAIDDEASGLDACSTENPEQISGMEHLSHVIYTSGSTGKPKGVAINHRPVTQLVVWTEKLFTADERECMLASTSMNFDLSVYENIATLALGGSIVLVENALYLPMDHHKHLVRTINTVPSAIKELLRQKNIPTNVTTVNLAGEQLKESVVWDLYALPHIERVYNLYGPSEDTTYSTWALMERDRDYTVKIGIPLNNTQAYILDANYQPLPVGVPGELLLAGIGLARGYLNRPDLTEERFLHNPFSQMADTAGHGPIMYRTGDLVRWRPNGQLECLGRIDHQVKIRGFRIELGEIEAVMQRHPHIHEVVVMDRDNQFGEKYLAGYVTLHHAGAMNEQEIRSYVGEHLPEYMVPAYVTILDAMPLNPNGKIDRKKLPEPQVAAPAAPVMPTSQLEHLIADVWKEVLGIEKVGSNSQFFEIGGNSLNATRVRFRLEEVIGREVQITDIFQYPTVAALAQYLDPQGNQVVVSGRQARSNAGSEVAVIGLALKLPGADTPDQFWQNLCGGVESATEFSIEELRAQGVEQDLLEDPDYVRRAFIIDDIDRFDNEFFGMSPREAQITDPQQRLFLEKAWEALEHAGYDPATCAHRIGVFAGVGANNYLRYNLLPDKRLVETVGSYALSFASEKDYMATRVSFKFNLRGPAMAVQTACSTGLMTIHMACRSIVDGESDMALAGGVCLWLPIRRGYLYAEGGTNAPDGRCRPFDHRAKGMVDGNGVCVVLLKRLEAAIADGDQVYAVVKGSAANNDGSEKVGFPAPSVEGQAAVIADAQSVADVHPDTITYIEAHGTGTSIGDPIEVAALTKAFGAKTDRKQYCALGSLKANIGHLDVAAGASGFIKTVLCLHHGQLPPTINYERPNQAINFERTPFYVNTELSQWASEGPRRAAVSSFGIGGTNVHAILQQAPERAPSFTEKPCFVLPISARSEAALARQRENLAAHLEAHPEVGLHDLAFTLQVGRRHFAHRLALVAQTREQALEQLRATDSVARVVPEGEKPPVVFMFSGQGSQYVNMGLGLYRHEPVFREVVDTCSKKLKNNLGLELRDLLYPKTEDPEELAKAGARLGQTSMTQPALFVIEYATAKLWMHWGIQPDAMIGHSIGEYVAATLAGVMTLDAALNLVAARGRLMQAQPSGAMMALSMSEEEVQLYLSDAIQIATINAPKRCVVAGPHEAIDALAARLESEGKRGSKLHTSHAFHSAMMDPALPAFQAELRGVPLSPPTIPYVSNVTGTWISAEEATLPEYYGKHLRNAVRFGAGLDTLFADGPKVFLEVGPGKTLMTFAKQQAGRDSGHQALSSIRHPQGTEDDNAFILASVAQLWQMGGKFDWARCHEGEIRHRIALPTYPFERKSFWIEPALAPAPAPVAAPVAASAAPKPEQATKPRAVRQSVRKHDPSEWFYQPLWKQTPSAPLFEFNRMASGKATWLVFLDYCGLGDQLVARLERAGQTVIAVRTGEWYAKRAKGYTLNPSRPEDYAALFEDLRSRDSIPNRVIHLWSVSAERMFQSREAFSSLCLQRGFLSLVHLAQAYDHLGVSERLQIGVISNNMQEVTDGDLTMPEKATLLGACKVIPREYPHIEIRSIDVVIPNIERRRALLVEQLLGELAVVSSDTVIAYRGRRRWLQTFEPAPHGPVDPARDRLRKGGVYLITGGLGGVGTMLSRHLAESLGAHLALIGRSPFPDRRDWQHWLSNHDAGDPTSQKIHKLIEIERLGGKVLALSADVADLDAMRHAVARVEREFGPIDGVIHAAGISPSGPIRNLTSDKSREVLAPKVEGTLVLEEIFRERELSFMLLMSSTSSVLGHQGNADYCAGNTFLDAYAHHQNAHSGFTVVAVNSDAWSDAGMAARELESKPDPRTSDLMLSYADGIEGLRRILSGDMFSQIVLSPRDFLGELDKVHEFEVLTASAWEPQVASTPVVVSPSSAVAPSVEPPRPVAVSAPAAELPKEPAAPPPAVSTTLHTVKELWQDSLGIAEIGPHDDFSELGGDSLLATMIASKLRRVLKVAVSPQLFNEEPTITRMTAALDRMLDKTGNHPPRPTQTVEPSGEPMTSAPPAGSAEVEEFEI